MDKEGLESRLLAIGKAKPKIASVVLPGLIPGPPSLEHDSRIVAGLRFGQLCLELGAEVIIVTTTGCHDCHGESGAVYFGRQNLLFAKAMGFDITNLIEIGENKSCHTANSLLRLGPYFERIKPDLVGLISNAPHLSVAEIYMRNLNPHIPFVTYSSGNGEGASGGAATQMSLEDYIRREELHCRMARTVDRVLKGRLLDLMGYSWKLRRQCRARVWPEIAIPTTI